VPDWRVEHIRITAFPIGDPREPSPNWWRDVVGKEPQTRTVRQGIGIQEAGPIRDNYCNLILEIQASRIDWLLSPVVRANDSPTAFPEISAYPQPVEVMQELLSDWLRALSPIRRLAVGCVLTAPTENKNAGYRSLAPLLPSIRLDPDQSSDFSYTINRHASSREISGLHINRISQWSVALLTGIQLTLGDGTTSVRETGSGISAIRLQMDINSAADRAERLPSDRVVPLFAELLTFMDNIANRGDIP
jgi:hypothetical protein